MSSEKKNTNTNLAQNKKAYHDYEILEKYEAGIVLVGSEVKSIKAGKVSLKESYARFFDNELFIVGMHVSEFAEANIFNHETTRKRKLLLNKRELKKLQIKLHNTGLTIIPLRIYRKMHLIKMEIGLCKGKREFEKRETIKEREVKRELDRVVKSFNK
ncbi:MAG: SsrA-binding protein SmpB [Candidatus Delongbacteria bacterium]|nr:SsrA-binding protein SmpB [Candidatus Delongbacteria bacterium]MCG2760792.1 SsrA-binding protein SmpB [Candidatus Delongbacteria bacterium]